MVQYCLLHNCLGNSFRRYFGSDICLSCFLNQFSSLLHKGPGKFELVQRITNMVTPKLGVYFEQLDQAVFGFVGLKEFLANVAQVSALVIVLEIIRGDHGPTCKFLWDQPMGQPRALPSTGQTRSEEHKRSIRI